LMGLRSMLDRAGLWPKERYPTCKKAATKLCHQQNTTSEVP
jgi:hypothetical protein